MRKRGRVLWVLGYLTFIYITFAVLRLHSVNAHKARSVYFVIPISFNMATLHLKKGTGNREQGTDSNN